MAVIDVLGAEFSSGLQRSHCVFDVVVLFKARLESFENINRLLDSGLHHIDLLETT